MPDSDELFTVVENISGAPRVFGFLGERGMRLGADEVVTVRGDLLAKLGAQTSARRFKALQRSLAAGSLRIRSRPAPVLWDAVDEQAKLLSVQGGVLGLVDPTYGASDSDSFAAV